jgi:hypothetical protein
MSQTTTPAAQQTSHALTLAGIGAASALAGWCACRWYLKQQHQSKSLHHQHLEQSATTAGRSSGVVEGYVGLIGGTPMVRLKSLSDATGCEILAKVKRWIYKRIDYLMWSFRDEDVN